MSWHCEGEQHFSLCNGSPYILGLLGLEYVSELIASLSYDYDYDFLKLTDALNGIPGILGLYLLQILQRRKIIELLQYQFHIGENKNPIYTINIGVQYTWYSSI